MESKDTIPADAEKIAELTAIIQTVRDRVRARYPEPGPADGPLPSGISVPVADLMPLVHARDAAQAKVAAIGSVNPRAGGPVNKAIQKGKKTIARALQWFVRDQVTFNSEMVAALEAVMEALNDHNRALVSLAGQSNERTRETRAKIDAAAAEQGVQLAARTRELSAQIDARAAELFAQIQPFLDQMDPLREEARELKDVRRHWIEWRAEWERKLAANEIQFLRSAADLQGAFQHRSTLMEANFRDITKAQHADFTVALDRATLDIQKRLWADLAETRLEYERLIHNELRVIRQRSAVAPAPPPAPAAAVSSAAEPGAPDFDYGRFAERFRGSEEYVRGKFDFYLPYFAVSRNVLDIGCGRGEFLTAMRDAGVPARGIDLSAESVELCRAKSLSAEKADLFPYLAAQPEGEFDGIFSAQVVEHLDPAKLPEMIRLCSAAVRKGGVLAIETPNPECLAIFATHFYLDPTHARPVPHPLLAFYMEEAGLGAIEVHRLSPAIDSEPTLAELPENFRNRFFGGLDYAIIGRKL